MSSFNSKNGMKPARKRQATHGSALVAGGLRCPRCSCAHVLRCQSANAPAAFLCGGCSHFFDVPQP